MNLNLNKKIEMPFWGLCLCISLMSLGFLISSYLIGRLNQGDIPSVLSELGVIICRTVLVTSSVGVLINAYLKYLQSDTSEEKLQNSGIKEIFFSRKDAEERLVDVVNNDDTKYIYLMGISLRDFLTQQGPLRKVWIKICSRLQDEQDKKNIIEDNRLKVKLLLLDPSSHEGICRYLIEESTIGRDSLDYDVPCGIAEIISQQQKIYINQQQKIYTSKIYLQGKLYDTSTFSFAFISNNSAFIEQYYYKDHFLGEDLPLIEYLPQSKQYKQLLFSIKKIWEKASETRFQNTMVGTAKALRESKILNIYRNDQQAECGARQLECIRRSEPSGTIDILAITGQYYVMPFSKRFFQVEDSNPIEPLKKNYKKVRFLIINPVCQQAILRAVGDSIPPENVKDELKKWTWQRHQNTRLYQDVYRTIHDIRDYNECGYNFDLRLYSSSVSCALLITDKSIFIEQYLYGRSQAYREGHVLGKEYPIFEFDVSSEALPYSLAELQLVKSHFDAIWDHYSISIKDYMDRRDSEELKDFEQSLSRAKIDLGMNMK